MLIPDEFNRRPGAPRPLSLSGRWRASRCFRTNAEGRIAVTDDWLKLLQTLERLGPVALQTRNACARMVAVMPVPALSWCPQRRCARDEAGALCFQLDHWHRAWARLAHCDCCGSPGRIEVCNRYGLDFLQLCALPECEAADWADILAEISRDDAGDEQEERSWEESGFVRVPAEARTVRGDGGHLEPLLARLADEAGSVGCMLAAGETWHRREFALKRVFSDAGVLTAGAGLSRFQLGLPAVRRLATTSWNGQTQLHVAGTDEALLLTLSAAGGAAGENLWNEALRSVFADF